MANHFRNHVKVKESTLHKTLEHNARSRTPAACKHCKRLIYRCLYHLNVNDYEMVVVVVVSLIALAISLRLLFPSPFYAAIQNCERNECICVFSSLGRRFGYGAICERAHSIQWEKWSNKDV